MAAASVILLMRSVSVPFSWFGHFGAALSPLLSLHSEGDPDHSTPRKGTQLDSQPRSSEKLQGGQLFSFQVLSIHRYFRV